MGSAMHKANVREWILRFLLLLKILTSEAIIVRLSCKQYGNFSVIHPGYVLQGSVIATFHFLSQQECKFECLMNIWCKSVNIENGGDERCELNDRTPEDVRDNVTLSANPRWTFITTNYSDPLVGDNCKRQKPCRRGVLCKDTCDCPGYKCYPCPKGRTGLHCEKSNNVDCGSQLTEPSGTITSPGYPADYQSDLNCNYTITVQEGKTIKLTFEDFSVEEAPDCRYDSLKIIDGANKTELCGYHLPPLFISKDNRLVLNFITDGSITRKGFLITYETV